MTHFAEVDYEFPVPVSQFFSRSRRGDITVFAGNWYTSPTTTADGFIVMRQLPNGGVEFGPPHLGDPSWGAVWVYDDIFVSSTGSDPAGYLLSYKVNADLTLTQVASVLFPEEVPPMANLLTKQVFGYYAGNDQTTAMMTEVGADGSLTEAVTTWTGVGKWDIRAVTNWSNRLDDMTYISGLVKTEWPDYWLSTEYPLVFLDLSSGGEIQIGSMEISPVTGATESTLDWQTPIYGNHLFEPSADGRILILQENRTGSPPFPQVLVEMQRVVDTLAIVNTYDWTTVPPPGPMYFSMAVYSSEDIPVFWESNEEAQEGYTWDYWGTASEWFPFTLPPDTTFESPTPFGVGHDGGWWVLYSTPTSDPVTATRIRIWYRPVSMAIRGGLLDNRRRFAPVF